MAASLRPDDPERVGRYELTGRLGEGGQGVVYAGRGPDGGEVAVKLLRAHVAHEPKARDRFVRELGFAERVAEFCTARVLDADIHGDQPYIVSEFVPGPSLYELVRAEGPRTGAALQRLAIGTATALAAIHRAGVVHRDFKPPNVLMGEDGPRVIDFGIAKALDGTSTMTSQVVGTPAYMAPEQVSGQEPGTWTDMFAWGVTILFAATGRSPFGDDTVPAVMHRILHADPDTSMLPQPLAGLVTACLAKDPAHRPTAPNVLLGLLGLGAPPGGADDLLAAGATAVEGVTPPTAAAPSPPFQPVLNGRASHGPGRFARHPPSPLPHPDTPPAEPRANAAAAAIAGIVALLTACALVWYALANVVYAADAPAGRWSGLVLENVLGGVIGAGLLLVAAGFTFARRIAGAWTLCALCVLYVVATIFVAPLLRGTALGAQLEFVFGFEGSNGVAIALATLFGVLTAITAAIAGSVKSYGPARRSALVPPGRYPR
ncbi:serine/threonine-protein kinase [Actinomadura algeriensis]|uniref:Ser/Thr protein kinase n=1 Tax=Actinomadura algeriensis TaxID=1679523 RepID=A0ABR9K1Q3_9ACTN|nr:serine/threonine-protein kinase [Actinomadura algeriensis]MBE1536784.1 putative Ser/Thr protein kinase [Actinomadura algeriensis]